MDTPYMQAPAELSPETRRLVEASEDVIGELRAAKLAAGRSYSISDAAGRVRHVHPDGTVRVSRDPQSEVVG